MVETYYRQLTAQWHALRAAVTKAREEQDGLATLEVLIIAGGLIVIAAALALLITNTYNTHKASIS